jgi:hypothetical protein
MFKQIVLLIFTVLALRLNFHKFINALLHNLETETTPVVCNFRSLNVFAWSATSPGATPSHFFTPT